MQPAVCSSIHRMRFGRWIVVVVCCLSLCHARQTMASDPPVDFTSDVLPLLQQRCQQCHGGVRRESELSLLTRHDALLPAASGAQAIVPGESAASELLRRVASSDPYERMPPSGSALGAEETDLLRRWIDQGAPWPRHWAFEPIKRPSPPPVQQTSWVRDPIDHFVLSTLETQGLQPSPAADRRTLIRRLYLDLLGLLPSVTESQALCRDHRVDWYERLVDRLLASPHFGERWGRHWLDQARYADTDGFEVDGPRPFAWRWRDWVIDALNGDLPLDDFTVQQIAGDLLPQATEMQQLATAYHRQSLTNREGGIDRDEARYRELVERVNATGTLWLGITLGCAQCHDHPYDPFTQHEYYQLYAFFNDTDDDELLLTGNQRAMGAKKDDAAGDAMRAAVVVQSTEDRITTIYHRGDFLQPGPPVAPAVLSGLHPLDTVAAASDRPNRLDLARWIIDRQNPLTPRVAANQIWLRLFGAGLVRTPGDFGARGAAPTHRELLDHLADELRSGGWSTKRLIRHIVTSAAYRQSSRHRPRYEAVDPLNLLWHRQNRYRVESELIRDLSLDASGLLSREIGGPSIYPPVAEEFIQLSFRSNYVWPTSQGADRYRRGMYVFFKRTLPYPNLDTFDCPDANAASMQREVSNTPLQALVLLNNAVHVEASQAFMRRVAGAVETDEQRLSLAFRIALGREPSVAEQQRLAALLQASRRYYAGHRQEARLLAGQQIAEIEVGEAAAWVVTLGVVLNLDEFLTRE